MFWVEFRFYNLKKGGQKNKNQIFLIFFCTCPQIKIFVQSSIIIKYHKINTISSKFVRTEKTCHNYTVHSTGQAFVLVSGARCLY